MGDNKPQEENIMKRSLCLRHLMVHIVVGVVVLLGQFYIQPTRAYGVDKKEIIMEEDKPQEENIMKIGLWFVHLIEPIVVGIVVLSGQFLIQPLIAEKQQSRTERWNEKRRTLLNAMELIRRQFQSRQMSTKAGETTPPSELEEPPSAEQINNIYSQLLLVVKNRQTIRNFLDCLPGTSKRERITLGDWLEFANASRQELGFEEIQLKNEDLAFVQPKKKAN